MRLWARILFLSFSRQLRQGSDMAVSLGFSLSFAVLAAFGMGQDILAEKGAAIGLLWLLLLLALTLHLPAFVEREEQRGELLQWQMLPLAGGLMLSARAIAVFAAAMLPLLTAMPILFAMFGLSRAEYLPLALLMLTGGWAYWLIGGCVNLLLLGSARAGGLQLLLTLPLGAPLLIFGCAASLRSGMEYQNAFTLLAAIATAITAIAPWLMGWLLRMHRSA